MNWALAADVAQVVSTLVAAIGIGVSVWLGVKASRDSDKDRAHGVRPFVLFEQGGQGVKLELAPPGAIPGINPQYVREILPPIPAGAQSRRIGIDSRWGRLKNFGNGSAVSVTVTFFFSRVTKAGEEFEITNGKSNQFPYSRELNSIPATPSHLLPGGEAWFYRLPTPIVCDWTGQLSELVGHVRISYEDTYSTEFIAYQRVRVRVSEIEAGKFEAIFTFSEEMQASEVSQVG